MTNSAHAVVSILIGADLGKSFRDSFSGASKQLSALGDAIKKVNDKASEIEAFRKSSRATKEASLSYQEAKQKLNLLNREMTSSLTPSKELQNNFRKAEVAAQKAKVAFMESAQATREMGKALSAAGVDFKNLNQQQQVLGKTLETLKKRQAALQANADAKSQNLSKRANYRAQMGDAIALGAILYSTIKPAVDFEYAMAQVGAVTEEAANSDGFKKLTAKARELGNTTQFTSAQAAQGMKFLGMAGFNTNQILAATPAILNLAIADNMELAQSAEIVSNILNGFAMKAEQAGEAADVLAQAAIATNTDVKMLGETMKFVAPAAAAVGGTLKETTALAGVLSNAGIQATMAGTMLRSAYLRLAAPARAGAKALGEFKNKMQITAEEMPDVAKESLLAQNRLHGLGVKIFTSAGKMRSMVEIMRDIHKATKNLSDDKKLSVIKDIFGTYSTSGALAIFKGFETGSVDEVLNKVNNADGTAKRMADRLSDTARGSFLEFQSAIESIGISLGTTLLPTISTTSREIAGMALKVSNFSEKFPVLTKYIGLTVVSIIGLKIATIALGYAFTFVRGAFLTAQGALLAFRTTITLVGLAMPVITTAIRAMGLALISNPIGLIIAGIVLAATLLIKNWTPVGEFFKNIFSGIIGWVKTAFDWVMKLVEPLKSVVGSITNVAGKAWNFVAGNSDSKDQKTSSAVGNIVSNFDAKNDLGKIPSFDMPNISSSPGGIGAQQISISAPITINAGGNMDEKKIADQVRIAIDETFRKLSARKLALNYDQ